MSTAETQESASEKNSESGFSTAIYTAFIKYVTSGQRSGQAWMNALFEVDPPYHETIVNTDADCFYNDQKIDAFKRVVFSKEE